MPSPFLPVVELLAAGAWPLGIHGGSLWVFVWNEAATSTPDFGPPLKFSCPAARKDFIFLSTEFRDAQLASRWKEAFRSRGWHTAHGPVKEDMLPPEAQLGERVRQARAVVGLLDEPDPDYGLPWWMLQGTRWAS